MTEPWDTKKKKLLHQFLLLAALTLLFLVGCSPLHAGTPSMVPASFLPEVTEHWGGGQDSATALAPAPVNTVHADEEAIEGVTAAAYIVMDGSAGQVLAQYNADVRRSPASLTKIMTALLVIERSNLDSIATVPEAITTLRASTLRGLTPGEHIPVRDVLYGLMLPSGNDAAITLATHIAGTESTFVDRMNAKAKALGLTNTHFTNSHGLDFREWGSPYSSARDLAELTRVAMGNAIFRDVVAARSFISRGGDQGPYLLVNFNTLLSSYRGANGVKIGYTRRAGHSIVASASRDGVWLIAVVLGSDQRDVDAALLLDDGFNKSR